ncbi:MAG: hypothetical protein G01um10148_777 [Parcubacteria group bacterium Gr01-1014_8]|nr:MAG: hypothetical protein G01um10148_777 [Parcubacteria group bacterium Gr01-1014_8]
MDGAQERGQLLIAMSEIGEKNGDKNNDKNVDKGPEDIKESSLVEIFIDGKDETGGKQPSFVYGIVTNTADKTLEGRPIRVWVAGHKSKDYACAPSSIRPCLPARRRIVIDMLRLRLSAEPNEYVQQLLDRAEARM